MKKIFLLIITIFFSVFMINQTNALNTCNTWFKINSSDKEINCHLICKKVKSNSSTNYFVPTKSANEWLQFRNNIWTKATLSECYTYSWYTGSYWSCSKTCWWWTKTRSVVCKRSDGDTVADANCSWTKPSTSTSCNTGPCCTVQNVSISTPNFTTCSEWTDCGSWEIDSEPNQTWWIDPIKDYWYTWHDTGFYQDITISKTWVKYKASFVSSYYTSYWAQISVSYLNSSWDVIGTTKIYTSTHSYYPYETFASWYVIMWIAPSNAEKIRIKAYKPDSYVEGAGIKIKSISLSTYCG